MAHVALRIAYDGARFHGSQIQPGLRTVHSELARALAALGIDETSIRWAGRTDSGVSALGNVAVVDVGERPVTLDLLPALTHHMRDAWAWALAEVPATFLPRYARHRRYRYHLASRLDAGHLEEILRIFEGTHDFSSFARVEPGVTPTRRVDSVRVRRAGPLLLVDVKGENFLHNQVRRMVEAARRVAEGELERKDVEAALAMVRPADLGVAPPEPLVLLEVAYPDLEFQTGGSAMLTRVRRHLATRVSEAQVRAAVLATMADDVPEGE